MKVRNTLALTIIFAGLFLYLWSQVCHVIDLEEQNRVAIMRIEEELLHKKYYSKVEDIKLGNDIKSLLDIKETLNMKATAYDLSEQSCGKLSDDVYYGITATGTSLVGKTREDAMSIAVDKSVIPLDSYVYIEFHSDKYKSFNGIYKAVDTGSAIQGNIIDVFMGDFNTSDAHEKTMEFGRQDCTVYVLNEKEI